MKRISFFVRDARDLREKRDRSDVLPSRVAPVAHGLLVSLTIHERRETESRGALVRELDGPIPRQERIHHCHGRLLARTRQSEKQNVPVIYSQRGSWCGLHCAHRATTALPSSPLRVACLVSHCARLIGRPRLRSTLRVEKMSSRIGQCST